MDIKNLFQNKYRCLVVMADGKTDIELDLKGDNAWSVYYQLDKIYPGAKRIRVKNVDNTETVEVIL